MYCLFEIKIYKSFIFVHFLLSIGYCWTLKIDVLDTPRPTDNLSNLGTSNLYFTNRKIFWETSWQVQYFNFIQLQQNIIVFQTKSTYILKLFWGDFCVVGRWLLGNNCVIFFGFSNTNITNMIPPTVSTQKFCIDIPQATVLNMRVLMGVLTYP